MSYQTNWSEVARIYKSNLKYVPTETLKRYLQIISDVRCFFDGTLADKSDVSWAEKEKQIREELDKRNFEHRWIWDKSVAVRDPDYWQCCGLFLSKDDKCPICGDTYND